MNFIIEFEIFLIRLESSVLINLILSFHFAPQTTHTHSTHQLPKELLLEMDFFIVIKSDKSDPFMRLGCERIKR